MTDKAKELNKLADFFQKNSGLILSAENTNLIIDALRLAATLEDFGEIGADKAPTLRKMPSGWLASISAPAAHGNIEETPIEAMRAAIDAAKPKHEHEWAPYVWYNMPKGGNYQRRCYGEDCPVKVEIADRLVPAKERECPQPGWTNAGLCTECGRSNHDR